MSDKMKKWLTITGCLLVCAMLVVLIGTQFSAERPKDDPLPSSASQDGDVVIKPETQPAQPADGGSADSSGAEQTIQGDVSKPEHDEGTLSDPEKAPGGTPQTSQPSQPSQPQGGGGLPGFGNVPNAGENQGDQADGEGDINKQVGNMG